MLLRHWSLFNSIQNSNYMVSKLNLAKEPGQQDLLRFLSRTGCPLEDAKQQFAFMNPRVKTKFRDELLKVASDFGLNDIMMTSFSRQFDAKTQLSATDMAYATSALLETPLSREPTAAGDQENANPNNQEAQSAVAQVQNRLHDNFWVAYDALDLR